MFMILNDSRNIFKQIILPWRFYKCFSEFYCKYTLNVYLGVGVGHDLFFFKIPQIDCCPDGANTALLWFFLQIFCAAGANRGRIHFLNLQSHCGFLTNLKITWFTGVVNMSIDTIQLWFGDFRKWFTFIDSLESMRHRRKISVEKIGIDIDCPVGAKAYKTF